MTGELRSVGLNGGPQVRPITVAQGAHNQALNSALHPELVHLLQTMTPVDFGVAIDIRTPMVMRAGQVIPPKRTQPGSGIFQEVVSTITIWSAKRQVVLTFPGFVSLEQLRGPLVEVARELAR